MSMKRRQFLRTVGAAGAAIPLSQWGHNIALANGEYPKRFIVVFTPNGVIPDEWHCVGNETDFSFRAMSAPLNAIREQLVMFKGVHMLSAKMEPGSDGHAKGMGHCLTATPLQSAAEGRMGGGISIDQYIANQIGTTTPFRSLELGVRTNSQLVKVTNRMCYRGPGEELPPDQDPRSVFSRLYGDPSLSPADVAKRKALKKSVLDYANGELDQFAKKLSAADQRKLDGHREGILAMEKRLGFVTDGCGTPPIPAELNFNAGPNMPTVGTSMMDMAVSALACDMTRVVSLQWNAAVGGQVMSWLKSPVTGFPVGIGHHELSHRTTLTNIFDRPQTIEVQKWYAQQFAYLVQELAKVKEGDGYLIDNTAVLWVNELGDGMYHKHDDIPFVLAGGKNLGIRHNRFLQYDNKPHNDLYVALANLYGIQTDTFGDKRVATGALSGLT